MYGYSIFEIASKLNLFLPRNIKNKGYIGRIIEKFFGLNTGNKPMRDFNSIGIELKTIPINKKNGSVLEPTFVCNASLTGNNGIIWEKSYIRYKLQRILWIPIQRNSFLDLKKCIFGLPFLWTPSFKEEKKIKEDWEDIMSMIVLGQINELDSTYGEILQIKKKAKNSKSLTKGVGEYGQSIFTVPRGFYLRKIFTNSLILNNTIL